jgi:beta-aspartyl-peptidase (threonine type)
MIPTLIVHGGAFELDETYWLPSEKGAREAAEAGMALLRQGKSALDAVEAASKSLELNPVFNAGRGASLTREGSVEVDGSIMDGVNLRFGAVAAVKDFLHPVSLARKVMEDGEHVMLCGDGALKFAKETGLSVYHVNDLVTEAAAQRLKKFKARLAAIKQPLLPSDTVGVCALDANGNLAVAISTGGTTGKRPGRVGDTPIFGAGFYADNRFGAAGATGKGEAIIQTLLSYRCVGLLAQGLSGQKAADETVAIMDREAGKPCGIILITPRGETGVCHNTPHMPWAIAIAGQEMRSGISSKVSVL